jgi:hypothetical protein
VPAVLWLPEAPAPDALEEPKLLPPPIWLILLVEPLLVLPLPDELEPDEDPPPWDPLPPLR